MADGHLVRVTGGWLKWDKNHYKWENIEESTANKSENKSLVLKRAKSCAAMPAVPEPCPLLKKQAKPLEPSDNVRSRVISKKAPMTKNKQIAKRHSLACLSTPSNVKEYKRHHSGAPQRAAPVSSHNKSCVTNAVLMAKPSSDDVKMTVETGQSGVPCVGQPECHQSSETLSSSCVPMNTSSASVEERMSHGHLTMMTILSSRLLRLRAVATLWRQCGGGALVSYLLKVNDDSVTADMLPILVKSLASRENCQNELSVESCFDLQPLICQLLHSKYEDHIVKVLTFLHTVLHCWDNEQQDGHPLTSSCLQEFVRAVSESVQRLSQQESAIHGQAKNLDNYMKHLVLKHCPRT